MYVFVFLISDNQLSGQIPEGLALSALTSLSLHNNQLEGPLPCRLTTLKRLQSFTCDLLPFPAEDEDSFCRVNDYIVARGTAGAIDNHSIDSEDYKANLTEEKENLLSALADFGADASALHWTEVDAEWQGVVFDQQGCVRSLILSGQSLAMQGGGVPESLEYLSNVLFLDLSHNNLGGSLPQEVCSLAFLQFLYLNDNQFRGQLLPEFEKLESLKTLNLSGNRLTGRLEPSLSSLIDLEILNLSNNKLEGEWSTLLILYF